MKMKLTTIYLLKSTEIRNIVFLSIYYKWDSTSTKAWLFKREKLEMKAHKMTLNILGNRLKDIPIYFSSSNNVSKSLNNYFISVPQPSGGYSDIFMHT